MDRLIHLPLFKLFVIAAVFWLIYLGLWDNLKSTILLSNASNLDFLGSHIYKQETLHHPLIYIAVISNLLFVATLQAVGLTPQGKIAAGILLFFWQIAILMRLAYEFVDLISLSWIQELVCIFLWVNFCFLFISRWIKTGSHKHIWIYAILTFAITLQQFSETTLATAFELNTTLYKYGNYILILALSLLLIFMPNTDKAGHHSRLNVLSSASWRFIFLALGFIILKTFPELLSDSSPKDFALMTGKHWVTLFAIGFIYYLTPLIFHKAKMHSNFLTEMHFILTVIGYSLIITAHYVMPVHSNSIFIDRIWEEVYINTTISPLFNSLRQAHLTYYVGTIILTLGTILLLVNFSLTIWKPSPRNTKH